MAWSFRCELSLREMMSKLNALWWDPWEEGDSSYYDYLGGQLTKEAVARIYKNKDHYVVNLRFFSKSPDPTAELLDAQTTLITKVLPIIGARDVASAEVFE
jgi:hypothetical protein